MKPITRNESEKRRRFAHPHDVWMNKDEGTRIAKRRWKRNTAKYLRKLGKREVKDLNG